jgi:hypothetical protein
VQAKMLDGTVRQLHGSPHAALCRRTSMTPLW